jgi:chromosomal replication initiator protein
VKRRFGSVLSAAASVADPAMRRVEIVDEHHQLEPAEQPPGRQLRGGLPSRVRSFDDFVIGTENRFAHAAALAVSELPGQAYNPLLIQGPPGTGKTHLLHAIASYPTIDMARRSIRYATLEQFTGDFTGALRHDSVDAFKQHYRDCDLLLLDDLQFVDGKTKTAEELLHTIDRALGAGAQVVLAVDRPLAQLGALEPRLRERLEGGLLVEMAAPGIEARLLIARLLAHGKRQISATPEVLEHVAGRVTANVRALEGALTRVAAYASLTGSELTVSVADQILKHLYPAPEETPRAHPRTLPISEIQRTVAAALDLSREDLISTKRSRRLVYARQAAMYLARELTDLSLPAIASEFGGRDHTTVLHAHRRFRALTLADESTRILISSLLQSLTPNPQNQTQPSTSP